MQYAKVGRDELQLGDHISCKLGILEGLSTHHGIIVQISPEIRVVHYSPIVMNGLRKTNTILCTDLSGFAYEFADIRRVTCTNRRAYPAGEVVRRALTAYRDQSRTEYSMLLNNCEHFASYCKYSGCAESDQTDTGLFMMSIGAVIGALLFTLVRNGRSI